VRAAAHLAAIVLLVPQTLVLAAFAALDHLTSERTIGAFFTSALELLDLLFGWGGLAIVVAVLLLIGAGFHRKSRPIAAVCLVAFAVVSTIVLIVQLPSPRTPDTFLFFFPALLSMALSVWTIASPAPAIPR